MKRYILNILLLLFLINTNTSFSQTIATDFTTEDCNGVMHNLFDSLDAGNVIVIAWVMPCGPCATYAGYAYSAVQSFSSSHPGKVHFYLVDDYANTSCANLVNWGNANNMPLNTTFSSGDISMSDYGANGMPKVVVLGGSDHTIYLNKNDNTINFIDVQAAIDNALTTPLEVQQYANDEFKIKSYPNPVDNVLTVSYKEFPSSFVNFSIVDILGQVVLLIEDNVSFEIEEQIRSINVSSLNNGNYFLRISSESIVESIPFVVYH